MATDTLYNDGDVMEYQVGGESGKNLRMVNRVPGKTRLKNAVCAAAGLSAQNTETFDHVARKQRG
ncbi:MAG: hypothetical protein FWH55_09135 [Oscillospiraceae bacterium]|nr:hypothetical protein [Oscillospiraceae bacterium]